MEDKDFQQTSEGNSFLAADPALKKLFPNTAPGLRKMTQELTGYDKALLFWASMHTSDISFFFRKLKKYIQTIQRRHCIRPEEDKSLIRYLLRSDLWGKKGYNYVIKKVAPRLMDFYFRGSFDMVSKLSLLMIPPGQQGLIYDLFEEEFPEFSALRLDTEDLVNALSDEYMRRTYPNQGEGIRKELLSVARNHPSHGAELAERLVSLVGKLVTSASNLDEDQDDKEE